LPFVPGNVPELAGSAMTADTIISTMADSVSDMPVSGLKKVIDFQLEGYDDPLAESIWP
jgi:hypothetical protein